MQQLEELMLSETAAADCDCSVVVVAAVFVHFLHSDFLSSVHHARPHGDAA